MPKNKTYFYINGYNFTVDTDIQSKSNINLVKNKMFVSNKTYGYTDIQWTNFSGEDIDLVIYSRITDEYTGEPAQPRVGGILDFYNENRTPHAVLKYWAQNFVPCKVKTNLHSIESGTYVIDEGFKQHNPTYDFIVSEFTLIQYEKPEEIEQTYWSQEESNNTDTTILSAIAQEIINLHNHTQTCFCTEKTASPNCEATIEEEVQIIQKYLQQWGYFPSYTHDTGSIDVNGKFCFYTTQALKKFQEDMGISVTGDFNEETKGKFLKKITET